MYRYDLAANFEGIAEMLGLENRQGPRAGRRRAVIAGAIRTPGAKSTSDDAPGTLDAAAVPERTLDGLGRGPSVPGATSRLARFVLRRVPSRHNAISP
jgi:hypothetical protein